MKWFRAMALAVNLAAILLAVGCSKSGPEWVEDDTAICAGDTVRIGDSPTNWTVEQLDGNKTIHLIRADRCYMQGFPNTQTHIFREDVRPAAVKKYRLSK